jgi:putative hydrolase of the HAD superfamily
MVLPEFSLSSSVVVLDLDDTLYKESAYQISGFREVCHQIERIYGRSVVADLGALLEQGEKDVLAGLCRAAGLHESVKQSLLWVYRLHFPKIELDVLTQRGVAELERRCQCLVILTDGRSITQRLKLKALGLENLPVYISEEYGDEKPSPNRFQTIMQNLSASQYVYIADNPAKDFIAPNRLGWVTIGIKDAGQNIHPLDMDHLSSEQMPTFWVSDLSEVLRIERSQIQK